MTIKTKAPCGTMSRRALSHSYAISLSIISHIISRFASSISEYARNGYCSYSPQKAIKTIGCIAWFCAAAAGNSPCRYFYTTKDNTSPMSASMQMDCRSISCGHTACPRLIQA